LATDDSITEREVTQLAALNETLREDYVDDCQKGVDRWNRALADVGMSLSLPHVGFNRNVGTFAHRRVTPDGRLIDERRWAEGVDSWLPSDSDRRFVESLMVGVYERGKMAGWVAPPATGCPRQSRSTSTTCRCERRHGDSTTLLRGCWTATSAEGRADQVGRSLPGR
jgi:benzoyl-CoA 2,3-dioxygenase component B